MNTDDEAVLAKLDRLRALLHARDPAVIDELWSGPGFRLVGSEQGESAQTRDELAALFENLFSKPVRLSWAWDERTVTRHGDLAWVYADGQLEISEADRTARKPYRMVCIFQKIDGQWHWRLFSGSEPVI